jgi:hypothetical protein
MVYAYMENDRQRRIMKTLFLLLLFVPLQGYAEIYKCKDARQVVVYQDTPCANQTLGKVTPPPAPSQQAVSQARRDLERMLEDSRYYDKKRREELAQKREELRLLEAQEQREAERLAAEAQQDEAWPYIPVYGPGYGYGRHARRPPHHHHPSAPAAPAPRRPCVIGYVGDKSCR